MATNKLVLLGKSGQSTEADLDIERVRLNTFMFLIVAIRAVHQSRYKLAVSTGSSTSGI